jgi:hypothetical protein
MINPGDIAMISFRSISLLVAFATGILAVPPPVADSESPRPFTDLRFTLDYPCGTLDIHGALMSGVECNYLVGHGGRLYATVSTWKQVGWSAACSERRWR